MSELRKANVPQSTYFITLTVVGWIDIFTRKAYVDDLIKNLKFCQENKGLEIFEYVVMPSHIHIICRRKEGLLSDLLKEFKSFTAKEILKLIQENPQESRQEWLMYMFQFFSKRFAQNALYMFWQKTSYPIEMCNPEIMKQKSRYIRMNPEVAGIVTDSAYYTYCSACPNSPLTMNIY
ncbi:MAG: transposase [Bacteroidota bacterium]